MKWIMTLSILCGLAAVAFGLIAANIEIRENNDAFMDDLKLQGIWASWAAIFAALATLLQAVHYFAAGVRRD